MMLRWLLLCLSISLVFVGKQSFDGGNYAVLPDAEIQGTRLRGNSKDQTPDTGRHYKPSSPLELGLTSSRTLEAGVVADLEFEVYPNVSGMVEMKLELPKNVRLLDGDLFWAGKLLEGECKSICAKVKVEGGEFSTINALAICRSNDAFQTLRGLELKVNQRWEPEQVLPEDQWRRGKKANVTTVFALRGE